MQHVFFQADFKIAHLVILTIIYIKVLAWPSVQQVPTFMLIPQQILAQKIAHRSNMVIIYLRTVYRVTKHVPAVLMALSPLAQYVQ